MEKKSCPAVSKSIAPALRNKGIAAQIDMTVACGQKWAHHDGNAFDHMSDIEYNGLHISVKAYHFTLMAGTMCEGKTTLPEIWEVYARRTHSNRFAYVVNETAYIMTIDEFKAFVMQFCEVERESKNSDRQHTGAVKVRGKRCEKAMVRWFEAQMAA